MWKDCEIEGIFRGLFTNQPNQSNQPEMLCIYGDPAYTLSYGIVAPFRGAQITARENAMNVEMYSARIVVEWAFGLLRSQFGYGEKKSSQKIGISLIGAYHVVAVLLTNCQTACGVENKLVSVSTIK